MPLPSDYDTVPIRGKYVYLDGTPASGSVRFTGKVVAISDAFDTVILPTTIVATLDSTGAFTVNIPATNDPNILPGGWTYTVQESLTGGGGRTYEIDVPLSAQALGIDLSEVAPATPASGNPTAFVTLTAFSDYVASNPGGSPDWDDVLNKPTTFAPSAHTHDKGEVGLGNVDNTSDLAKPVSTAQQAALDAKRDILVLAPGAPVPGGTRVGSIILRTA